jgi:hypothetical protein
MAAVVNDAQLGGAVVTAFERLQSVEERFVRVRRRYLVLLSFEVKLLLENLLQLVDLYI